MVKLDSIYRELQEIRRRLDDLEKMLSGRLSQPIFIPETKLLSLPDNLRKTYLIVFSRGECSASEVSTLSGRSRAIESAYMNQLVRLGWLKKRRISKKLVFSPANPQTV
jgi:hypothetical protein